jgi:HK97 gp10 family phage protein
MLKSSIIARQQSGTGDEMETGITFTGMDELKDKLDYMISASQKASIISSALKVGGAIIAERVKPKLPRSEENKEHAADHIVVSVVKKSSGIPYVAVGPDPGDNSKFFYLKFYEFGTKNPNALGKIIPALHMFGKTIIEEATNVKDAMAIVIKEALGL